MKLTWTWCKVAVDGHERPVQSCGHAHFAWVLAGRADGAASRTTRSNFRPSLPPRRFCKRNQLADDGGPVQPHWFEEQQPALSHQDNFKRRMMRWTWVGCHLVPVPVLVGMFSALSAAAISTKDFLSLRQVRIFSMTACSSGVLP